MKLSDFRKKSITRRVWSVVLTIVMVFNLMCGYVAVSESSVTDVKAATKTLAELKAENKASSATYRNVMYYGGQFMQDRRISIQVKLTEV